MLEFKFKKNWWITCILFLSFNFLKFFFSLNECRRSLVCCILDVRLYIYIHLLYTLHRNSEFPHPFTMMLTAALLSVYV